MFQWRKCNDFGCCGPHRGPQLDFLPDPVLDPESDKTNPKFKKYAAVKGQDTTEQDRY